MQEIAAGYFDFVSMLFICVLYSPYLLTAIAENAVLRKKLYSANLASRKSPKERA